MNFEQAANTLRQRFKTDFHNRNTAPIGWDNVSGLVKPNGDFIEEAQDSNGDPIPWVRFAIRPSRAQQISSGAVGNRRFRQPGTVIVQIFVPTGTGDGKAYQIADDIAVSLRGVTDSGVTLKATSPPQFVGPDGGWWQSNTTTEFQFDLTD